MVGLLCAAVLVAPFASAARPDPDCTGDFNTAWTTIPKPRFPKGPQGVTGHSFDLSSGPLMVATNGVVVMSSGNHGCDWSQSFALPDASWTIESIETLSSSSSGIDFGLVIREDSPAGPRPHVVIGHANGDGPFRKDPIEWSAADSGLPPTGDPDMLATSVQRPGTLYLGIDSGSGTPAGSIDLLYASTDLGDSWSLRSELVKVPGVGGTDVLGLPSGGLTHLVVDPRATDNLWGAGPQGVFVSTNGGRSFDQVPEFAGAPAGPIAIWHGSGAKAAIIAYQPTPGGFLRSTDGGENFFAITSPGDVTSLGQGPGRDELLLTAGGHVFAYHAPSFSWLDAGAPIQGSVDVVGNVAGLPIFLARAPDALAMYAAASAGSIIGTDIGGVDPNVTGIPDNLIDTGEPALSPGTTRVKLGIGQAKTVTYTLALPEKLHPVDVVFLIDSTNSMEKFIAGLAESYARIAKGLLDRGLNVRFGVAEHRAYPDAFPPRPRCAGGQSPIPAANCEPNFVYRKLLDPLHYSGAALVEILENLEFGGGGQYDAQAGALKVLATSEGIDNAPPGQSEHDVQPGQGIGFREKTSGYRIVILGTDEPFGQEGSPQDPGEGQGGGGLVAPDIPGFDEVIDGLNAKGIKHVGLSIGREPPVTADLERVSVGTGAVAPESGVDCDGDGAPDLSEDDGLVCQIGKKELEDADNLIPAVVNLVEAVGARRDFNLEVVGGEQVVQGINPRLYPKITIGPKRDLKFDVTYRCRPADAGKTFKVALSASREARALDRSLATVVCTEKPVLDVPPLLSAFPLLLGFPAPPPVPPSAQIGSQAQSQAQFNAQAAAAHQEQEEPQLAMVHSFHEQLENELALDEAYEMTSFRERSNPAVVPVGPYGAAATAMAFAFGWASRSRNRTRTRVARVKR